MADPLYRLLTLLSPAFPTGGFAHSHALEWSVEAGDVTDAPSLHNWLATLLQHGAGTTDGWYVRNAHRLAQMRTDLSALAAQCAALCPSAERLSETLSIGTAFAKAAGIWHADLPPNCPYPVAVGAVAARCLVSEDNAVLGYLQAWTATLVSAGIRLIPLGQTDGLRVIAGLEDLVIHTANSTRGLTGDDIGAACFRADIASMKHETQYTRLFRT